ncbi:MAG TPA: FKBP-type peptidyl-prolyl cis-trans isomerase [Opitutaceae bacterium]|nr:FKBP-type peptidyl-prolyl cis-trans isomerase [Opitutaceae bacterium]
MRNIFVLLLLGVLLLTLALVVRSGLLARKNPGEPMSKYMRETLDTAQNPQFSTAETLVLDREFTTAVVLPSGLRYVIRTPGAGDAKPREGQTATVQYEGRFLLDGRKFDSSYDRGQPFIFRLGVDRVIQGWETTVLDMKRGEKRTVVIPWWLAYGAAGHPPAIPPKASLVFDIELLDFH